MKTRAELIETMEAAIERADIGYSLRLVRLVDGEAVFHLTFSDEANPRVIEGWEDEARDKAHAIIAQRKRHARATAALLAAEAAGAVMMPAKHTPEIMVAVQAAYEANPTIPNDDDTIKPAMWDFFATGWPAALSASPFRAEG